jgi:hypothetical protein
MQVVMEFIKNQGREIQKGNIVVKVGSAGRESKLLFSRCF